MRMVLCLLALFFSFSSSANVIHYPERAEALRIDGAVSLIYDIDVNGKVNNIRVVKSNPDYVFDRSVVKQMSKWEFPKNEEKKDVELNIIFDANHRISKKY
ncbi:TonB family protein [Pantoea ananatis]|uniref:TonB family protein n=1 Tax=Pantoea ananas TaxID=553 RepID=UPI0030191956